MAKAFRNELPRKRGPSEDGGEPLRRRYNPAQGELPRRLRGASAAQGSANTGVGQEPVEGGYAGVEDAYMAVFGTQP